MEQAGIKIYAYTSQVGDIALDNDYTRYNPELIETNDVRCPDPEKAAQMYALIDQVRSEGDTIGGVVTCVVKGVPVGLGEPVFDKLHARLARFRIKSRGSFLLSYNQLFLRLNLPNPQTA